MKSQFDVSAINGSVDNRRNCAFHCYELKTIDEPVAMECLGRVCVSRCCWFFRYAKHLLKLVDWAVSSSIVKNAIPNSGGDGLDADKSMSVPWRRVDGRDVHLDAFSIINVKRCSKPMVSSILYTPYVRHAGHISSVLHGATFIVPARSRSPLTDLFFRPVISS